MAWIKAYQSLERHHKILKLMNTLKISNNEAIGMMVKLWWWCLDYAEDGDLSGLEQELNTYLGHPDTMKTLTEIGFVDENTCLVHDWIDYAFDFLKSKYHTSNPKKLKIIVRKYRTSLGTPKAIPKAGQIKIDIDRQIKTDKDKYLEFVYLNKEEYRKLTERFGESGVKQRIYNLNLYAHKIGERKFKSKYSSHYAVILSWEDNKGGKSGTGTYRTSQGADDEELKKYGRGGQDD